MAQLAACCVCLLALAAANGGSEVPPPHSLEIKLPPGIDSSRLFVRYALAGDEMGGWIQPRAGVSSFAISTVHDHRPAARIRAILYAPGCAIQTLNVPLSESNNPPYQFVCHPLRAVPISGTLTRCDRFYGSEVKLQARYIVRWANVFLGLREDVITAIPVGDVALPSSDGHFQLSVPDLSQDALAGAADHPGELQIWASQKAGDRVVAQITPAGPEELKARMGGIRIQSEYPSEIVFTPCASSPWGHHDAEGFALRPAPVDACDR